jgi:hypothetical protein
VVEHLPSKCEALKRKKKIIKKEKKKCKALSSNPSTAEKQNKAKQTLHEK